jgi:hypothetical protein
MAKHLNLAMTDEQHEGLRILAFERRTSITELIREAIARFLASTKTEEGS